MTESLTLITNKSLLSGSMILDIVSINKVIRMSPRSIIFEGGLTPPVNCHSLRSGQLHWFRFGREIPAPQPPAPMAYAILRVGKAKSMGSIGGKDSHEVRQRETPNANPELSPLNKQVIGSMSAKDDVQERIAAAGVKPRKDSVLAIDVFATASPEYFTRNHPEDLKCQAFEKHLVAFLEKEFGKGNVVNLRAHHDETSPHWHATIVPIREKTIKVGRTVKQDRTENRLCCKDWLGGDRHTLSKLQTRFADAMKPLGLERGIEGSKAKHTSVKDFYALVNEATAQAQNVSAHFPKISTQAVLEQMPKPGVLDRLNPEAYAKQALKTSLEQMQQQLDQANAALEKTRRHELNKTATPAINALNQKGETRMSQAEQALLQLGYRLNEHGQLVNLQEERKEALRGTISYCLRESYNLNEFQAQMESKGVLVGYGKKVKEQLDGKEVDAIGFNDGKGFIPGHELGVAFSIQGIVDTLRANHQKRVLEQQEEARKKQEAQYRKLYLKALGELFTAFRGDCTKVARYLKDSHRGDPFHPLHKVEIANKNALPHALHWFQQDAKKSSDDLIWVRSQLEREGLYTRQSKRLGL